MNICAWINLPQHRHSRADRPMPPSHLFAALLLWLSLCPAALAQLSFGPVVTASPASATVGGTVMINASRLTGNHSYSARLVPTAGSPTTLFTQTSNADSLLKNVVIPSVAGGKYTLELRADNVLLDTASFGVVPPLAVTYTPTTSTPGASVAFTVTGLTAGSLVLDYDGAPAFGPVSITGSSYSGKFRIPTDRPSQLPATVVTQARNIVGKIAPRIGNANFATKVANTSPFAKIVSATPSTGTVKNTDSFNVTGKLAFNESNANDVTVSQFWKAADGSVVPFGASTFSVQSNGDFTSTQRAPQWGTMSAMQAAGSGQVMTVTQFRDGNDVPQFQSGNPVGIVSQFDTDPGVDITLLIRDSNSAPLQHARVDLSTEQADDLFDDPNNAPVNIDGSSFAGHATQYNPNPQQSEGCPTGLQRQYSDAQGRVEFPFAVDPPGGGYLLDGSHPYQVTIAPSQDCVQLPDGKGGYIEHCTTVDPAGLAFTLAIRTAHLGYGYRDSQGVELPVMVNARVDRYTGQITTATCKPNQACTQQSFNRSANLVINLPAVGSSLEVGDPYFQSDAESVAINPRPGQAAGGEPYRFDYVADLTQFYGSAADFKPLRPPTLRFAYHRGAGKALREAHLLLENNHDGYDPVGDFSLESSNNTSCESADGVEVWKFHFGDTLSAMLRFPRVRWQNKQGDFHACGYIYGSNDDGSFNRKFCLYWKAVSPDLLNLTDIVINDGLNPSQVNIIGTRLFDGGATHSDAAPTDYHVGAKDNSLASGAQFSYCVPSAGGSCSQYSEFSRQDEQFSHTPTPGAPEFFSGDATQSAGSRQWEDLFNITIPLFRWIWGVPELLSAEVFADLGIGAQTLLDLSFNPQSGQVIQTTGGAMSVGVHIGVDIDVLFGILVDAGAMITGAAISSIVAKTGGPDAGVNECFRFTMDFAGWLEIGCPIPNPFDPTCYIPDINETFNILDERDPNGCSSPSQNSTIAAGLKASTSAGVVRPPPIDPLTPEERRALYRHPAIAFDTDGNGLALWLDDHGQLVSGSVLGRSAGATHPVVSTGWGIRDVAVAFIGPARAVAVWAENALSDDPFRNADLATRALNQHLRYATWDGKGWSAVADLTAPGKGEGQVRLARCTGSVVTCPRNGRVTAVWQRNTGQGIYAAKMHVFTSNFDGTGWTTPVQVDQSGTLNITPALTYQAGNPVIGWVRHDPAATLDDTTLRRFAYRQMDGHSTEHVDAAIPVGIAAPSLAAVDNNTLAVAFTVVDKGFGFIGTRQALFLGGADCNAGLCSFTSWKMHDTHGRSIYGERPQLLIDGDGQAVVTMRGLSFGALAGNPVLFKDDPPGMQTTSGDLIQMRSPLADQPVPLIALSRDAATHFQPVAALDPSSGDVVALSVNLPSPTTFALQVQPTTMQSREPVAASLTAVDAGVELAAPALAPDLTIDSVIVASGPLVPGGNLAVKVSVLNQGSAWIPDADRNAHVSLWWDNPQTRAAQTSSAGIPALDPGQSVTLQFSMPVPAVFHNDERQTLRATIVASAAVIELDGTNNEIARNLGGMPLPINPIAVLAPGTRFVNLAWDTATDARVKGYRVYVEDEPGKIRPLGSSFNNGFVDLAAQYGAVRRYYITTYSARGVESEKVGPLIAAPLAGTPSDDDVLFKNGFEAPAP